MKEACLVTMSRPNEVLIGIQLPGSADLPHVYDSAEKAIGSAWVILDSARKAFDKGGRKMPEPALSAMKLIEAWYEPADER